jgi:hypothetical protein
LRARAPDVQAALTVLGRGGFAADGMLDLTATDLRRADLKDADLRRATSSAAACGERCSTALTYGPRS